MVTRVVSIAAAALLLSWVPAAPAAAQKGPDDTAQVITIRVCNNTNDAARVALSYQPVGRNQFYNEGWYGVPARGCLDLAQTENAYIYGYAEVENKGDIFWGGDHPLCVQYPGPYAFWTTGSQYCAEGQDSRSFVVMHAENWGVYTWSLDP